MNKKELNKCIITDREKYLIGNGWQGLKVHRFMIINNIGSMEYNILSIDNKTYVETWSKEAKEVLNNLGYKKIK